MAENDYDTIVLGIGGMGSATTYHLAKRGVDVLGIERFNIPHTMGSSHGSTRIIRLGYFEGSGYVPLLRRSYELWNELEEESNEDLLHKTGMVVFGPEGSEEVTGTLQSCEEHGLEHKVLTGGEVNERYEAYSIPEDYVAVFEPGGGFLACEKCVVAHVQQAYHHGAEIHAQERVEGWSSTSRGITVTTDRRRYTSDNLVIAGGAWVPEFVPSLDDELQREVHSMVWLQPQKPEAFQPNRFPVFIADFNGEEYYGFPQFEVPGFKFARFEPVIEDIDPETVDRTPVFEDAESIRPFAEECFPSGSGPIMRIERCLMTQSPDRDFIVDTLPDHSNVVVGAGFSGHGFKMSSVIGEILADLSTQNETGHDIEDFRISRL